MAEWLVHRTHNPLIAGSSLIGASNILGQDMNPSVGPGLAQLVERLAHRYSESTS